jgi:hypothetical protein
LQVGTAAGIERLWLGDKTQNLRVEIVPVAHLAGGQPGRHVIPHVDAGSAVDQVDVCGQYIRAVVIAVVRDEVPQVIESDL